MSLKWSFLVAFTLQRSWWVVSHCALSWCPVTFLWSWAWPWLGRRSSWTGPGVRGPGYSFQAPTWPLVALLFSSINRFHCVPLNWATEKATFYIESKDKRSLLCVLTDFSMWLAPSASISFLLFSSSLSLSFPCLGLATEMLKWRIASSDLEPALALVIAPPHSVQRLSLHYSCV